MKRKKATPKKPSPSQMIGSLGACNDSRAWLGHHKTLASAWAACRAPHWMIWALIAAGFGDTKRARLLACELLLNTPFNAVSKTGDLLHEKYREALAVSRRFALGRATAVQLKAAQLRASGWEYGTHEYRAYLTAGNYKNADGVLWAAQIAALRRSALGARRVNAAQADIIRRVVGNPSRWIAKLTDIAGKRLARYAEED